MKTANLTLRPHFPAHLIALAKSVDDYERVSGFKTAMGIRDFLLMASPQFFQSLVSTTEPDPWKFGFAIFHTLDNVMIGLCGFAGGPDSTGSVELGYSISPAYQNKGFATETANALVEFATKNKAVRRVCAHTLAETSASTRVLQKCGFEKIAEITDPEGNLVWRWERACSQT